MIWLGRWTCDVGTGVDSDAARILLLFWRISSTTSTGQPIRSKPFRGEKPAEAREREGHGKGPVGFAEDNRY